MPTYRQGDRLLSPIQVDYDISNSSHNLWVAIVHYFNTSEDVCNWQETQPYCFGTLGQAMHNYINEIHQWEQEKPGLAWKGLLKQGNNFGPGAYMIELHQMIYLNVA